MTIVYAAPTLRHASPEFLQTPTSGVIWAFDLQTAVNKACPGDEVVLLPGRYSTPAVLHRSGRVDAPITLRAAERGTVILDGGRAPMDGSLGGMDPLDADFAMLRLFGADHWVIQDLRFEQCWPTCIYMRCATHVTVRNCDAEGGRYFVYLRQSRVSPTHHITLRGCKWVQDAAFDMWRGNLTWNDVKGYTKVDATYFNGAFLGGFDVAGRIVVRDCDIRHAFNAIRLDMRDEHVSGAPVSQRNRDVAIFDNSFSFIRDNAVEPEVGAQNWRVFNNLFYAVHGAISLDLVASRDLFIVGNRVLNDHRAGVVLENGDDGQPNQGGKLFKFFKPEPDKVPSPRRGLWSLYNSALTRTAYAKKGITRHLHDAFSLLGMLPQWYPQSTEKVRNPFDRFDWRNVIIEGMISDAQGFPGVYRTGDTHLDGIGVTRVFVPTQGSRPTQPSLGQVLGGWDGVLEAAPEVAVRRSRPLRLETAEGPLVIPGDRPIGAQDIDDLGLRHWRDPWPDGPPGAQSDGAAG